MRRETTYLDLKDEKAEQSVLGAILIDGESIGDIADYLDPEDFFNENNRLIYRACLNLYHSNKKIDIISLREELKKTPEYKEGFSYLTELVNLVPTSGLIRQNAEIIKNYALRRRIFEASEEAREKAIDFNLDISEVLISFQNQILTIGEEREELEPDSEKLAGFLGEINQRIDFNQKNRFVGLDTGFKHLNETTLGLQTGLWIIGAKPSLGKTTFVKQLLDQVAMNNPDIPCLFLSYEQSSFELILKTIGRFSSVNTRDIQKGRLTPEEEAKINEAIERYNNFAKRIYVLEADGARTTPQVIRVKAKQILKKHNSKKILIVIDYLQLIPPEEGFYRSEKERVDRVCSDLRRIARDLDCPIVVVSSLHRPAYQKEDKPSLASFKESGGIEYTADLAIVMTEDKEETNNLTKTNGRPIRRIVLKIVKNRNGERAKILFDFDLQTATFTEISKGELLEEEPFNEDF